MIPLGHPSTWSANRVAPFGNWDEMTHFGRQLIKQNDDLMVMIDGPEGAGKSTLGFYLAKALDPDWEPETGLIIDFDDWCELFDVAEGKVFLLDEGGDLLFSRDAMTKESKLVVRIFQMARIFNHTIIVVCPNIHWVDLYVRNHRALLYANVKKQWYAGGVIRGQADWHWPKRRFNRKDSEWEHQWQKVYTTNFHPVPDTDGVWSRYEQLKKMKVIKRQQDLQLSLTR